ILRRRGRPLRGSRPRDITAHSRTLVGPRASRRRYHATGWALESNVGSGLRLCGLCSGGDAPEHTIIGGPDPANPLRDTGANPSIAGNGPHNPFLAGVVSFTLNIPGLTAASVVNSVVFSVGTTQRDNVPAVQRVAAAPALLLVGAGSCWRERYGGF